MNHKFVKNFKNKRGYTLAEVVIAMGVFGIGIVMLSTLALQLNNQTHSSLSSMSQTSDLSSLFQWLQRFGFRRDLAVYGFTGTGATTGVNISGLSKVIVPYPDKCGDLVTDCPNDTAFFLALTDINKSQLVTAICALSPNKIIVDLGYDNLGTGSLVSNGINVTSHNSLISGKIDIDTNAVLLAMNDPTGVLFVATGRPSSFNPLYNAGTGLYNHPQFGNNPNCVSLVKDRTKLVVVNVEPYRLPQSGTVTPPSELVLSSFGRFPIRLTQTRMISIGRNPTKKERWGIRFCDQTYPNSCTIDEALFVDKVGAMSIFEYFKAPLGANPLTTRYSIGRASDCADSTCKNLSFTTPIRFLASMTEFDIPILESTRFSYKKQNYLDKLEFQVEDLSGGKSIMRRYYLESL